MIYIITGHYGSGKTEIAINLALSLDKPVVIDLDIVNPYFRTKDAEEKLSKLGIKMIAPDFANTNVDLPSLPPDITGALQGDKDVIVDVGGDDDGAIALGRYNKYIKEKEYEMIFVVNTKRPETSDAEGIIDMMRKIDAASRLKITSIVNNTNLKGETTADIITESFGIVEEVSDKTGIGIRGVSARTDISAKLDISYPVMPIELHLTLPWET